MVMPLHVITYYGTGLAMGILWLYFGYRGLQSKKLTRDEKVQGIVVVLAGSLLIAVFVSKFLRN